MAERRMLIVPTELIKRIDENRDNMRRADFIEFLMNSHLGEYSQDQEYVTRDEVHELEQSIREELHELENNIKGLLQNFLDFSVSYGLELGKQPVKDNLKELDEKLGELNGTFTVRKPEKSNQRK